uniref:Uncharacterized protein n=1 Tax=Noctiluca scintillans TaxID=2966 RepID=A0A6T9BBC1_NOCSC|mmetsp:Transcript_44946/g.119165  ORF Transcript_44946/g.119165 Transcript_44946/m.119165 type:complete len:103 (+) Transcript_44946:359-667(+)
MAKGPVACAIMLWMSTMCQAHSPSPPHHDLPPANCRDWECRAGCGGVDVGICKTTEYVLCVGGCLNMHFCVKRCLKTIYEPCVEHLIADCEDKCCANALAEV